MLRKITMNALEDILENKMFLSEMKNDFENLDSQNIALANMMLLTALRNLVFIKKTIRKFTKKKIPNKIYFVEYALILGVTEILFLRTPEYATINSYVDIVKKRADRFAGGFVNAILRNVCRNKEEIMSENNDEFFPENFKKILRRDYSKDEIEKIEAFAKMPAKLDINVKSNPEEWAEKLKGKHIAYNSVRIENAGNITKIEGYDTGDWWVQDIAASLPVNILGDIKGKRVLDLCAAPGGKTAQLVNAGAIVVSLDVSDDRMDVLEDNLERLNLTNEKNIVTNGITYLKDFKDEKFDIILLDAPCSATGTLRRNPEIVHIKTIEDIKTQSNLQKGFLQLTSNALKSGGILLYCTCSLNKIEGEEQIKNFLKENDNFKISPITIETLKEKETNLCNNIVTKEGFIRTLPYHLEDGIDSFFIAKLQKV